MNPAAWKEVERLVDEALEREGADRQTFLEGLWSRDADKAREVLAFFAAEEAARGFLGASVERQFPALMEEAAASFDETVLPEGRVVGSYRVLGELGHGGMGAVFLAERADGHFEQRVALKLVKRGMDTEEILGRFRAERQILARLHHPHIARLLDGGATEGGQPYFAMEYVEGLPLTLYCDGARVPIEGRLRLFVQICEAVEYAHRNLVVHRDLKPSNILVTSEGVAKLLDFGIAKVLDPTTDEGGLTATGQEARPMTPQYAAPEQLLGQPVTTATDVYSLGLILFELLCGRRPQAVRGLGPEEIERVLEIRERDSPSALAGPTETEGPRPDEAAAARGLSPAKLARRLRGDLDRIVGTALRSDPNGRYASARALADDVERSLAGLPLIARPASLAYRTSKFVRRHRVGVAATTLVAASLVAGLIGTLWQARQAVRQARKAEMVKTFVFSLFGQADPNVGKGKEITVRQLVEEGAKRIPAELSDQPEIEAEMLVFVGTVHYRLGLIREAGPLFEQALSRRRELLGDDSLGVAEAELWVGTVALMKGELDRARELLDSAVRKRTTWLGAHHGDTAHARGLLGRVYFEKGELAQAETLVRSAIADQRAQAAAPQAELASNINFLGRILQAKADYDGAEQAFREGLEMRRKLFGDEHTRVSESQMNLAQVMRARGDPRGAEPWFRRVLELDRRILGNEHEKVAIDLNDLGFGLIVTGNYEEAEQHLREALAIRTKLHGPDHRMTAQAHHSLARVLRYRTKLEEAETSSRRALTLAASMLGDDHSNVAIVRQELAEILRARAKLGEAEAAARRALSVQKAKLPAGHPTTGDALVTLARVLMAAGKNAEAEALLREAVSLRQKRFGDGDWRSGEAQLELANCLRLLGRLPEAASSAAAARATLVDRLGPTHPLTERAARMELQRAARGPV